MRLSGSVSGSPCPGPPASLGRLEALPVGHLSCSLLQWHLLHLSCSHLSSLPYLTTMFDPRSHCAPGLASLSPDFPVSTWRDIACSRLANFLLPCPEERLHLSLLPGQALRVFKEQGMTCLFLDPPPRQCFSDLGHSWTNCMVSIIIEYQLHYYLFLFLK